MKRLVIRGARLFDGETWLSADAVVVESGVIADIGTRVRVANDDEVVDADGATLLPGLIDAHAHVGSRGALRRALRFGVTTVCDMFMDWRLAAQLKAEDIDGSPAEAASLRSAGTLVTAPGGHGSHQLVGPIPTLATAREAPQFVAERLAEGSDWIKVVYDDFHVLGQDLPTLDREVLAAVIEAAHAHGRKVVVHVGSLGAAQEAVAAGADILGHWVADALPAMTWSATSSVGASS